jgi:2-polyprenyl-6-methoxyphenol hydroxylase-like FAD-dependent oxidoreductase
LLHVDADSPGAGFFIREVNHGTLAARKVVIVGAGAVGATFAYALAQSGVADENRFDGYGQNWSGQVMDLAHELVYPNVRISVGSAGSCQYMRSMVGRLNAR